MRSAPHEGEVQQREERRRNKGADHREVEKRCHIAHESCDDDNADKGRDRHPDIEVASRALILFHQEAQRLIIGTGIPIDNGERRAEHAEERDHGNEQFGPVADGECVHLDQLADIGNTGCLNLFTRSVLDECTECHEYQCEDCRADIADVEVEDAIPEAHRIQAALGHDPHRIQGGNLDRRRHPAHQRYDKAERSERPGIRCDELQNSYKYSLVVQSCFMNPRKQLLMLPNAWSSIHKNRAVQANSSSVILRQRLFFVPSKKSSTMRPTFRSTPDFVVGMPVCRANWRFAFVIPVIVSPSQTHHQCPHPCRYSCLQFRLGRMLLCN